MQRIDLTLQREELIEARIRSAQLRETRVWLVRQIVSASDGKSSVDCGARPGSHVLTCALVGPLLVVDDQRKYLFARPREQRAWIASGVANAA